MAIIRIGDRVKGELGEGRVVAMTLQWCVYQTSPNQEYAEQWCDIQAVECRAGEIYSPLKVCDYGVRNEPAPAPLHVSCGETETPAELYSVQIIGFVDKMNAIRAYRSVHNCSLMAAKQGVEDASPQNPGVMYIGKTRAQAEDLARMLQNSDCLILLKQES